MCFKAFGHEKKLKNMILKNRKVQKVWTWTEHTVQVWFRFRFRFGQKVVWTGLNRTLATLIPADYCVWLDKASVDDHTNQHAIGWAAMGRVCICCAAFVHGQWYSVLPALTCKGMIALNIFEGSVNKERFLTFLNEQVVRLSLSLSCHQLHHWFIL